METISTPNAPAAIGPYSQGKKSGQFVFFSGQIAINPATGKIEATTVAEQTEQICANIKNLLESENLSFDNVIKTTCFLTDISTFAEFNAIYGKYFTGKPARSCVAVSALPANALCEVEIIAEAK